MTGDQRYQRVRKAHDGDVQPGAVIEVVDEVRDPEMPPRRFYWTIDSRETDGYVLARPVDVPRSGTQRIAVRYFTRNRWGFRSYLVEPKTAKRPVTWDLVTLTSLAFAAGLLVAWMVRP